jgi:hypothetical protein
VLDQWFRVGDYVVLIGGVGLMLTTILHPNGLSASIEHGLRSAFRSLRQGIPARVPAGSTARAGGETQP